MFYLNQLFVLVLIFNISFSKCDVQQQDLIDEARAEYEDLQSLVSSYISTGFIAIDSMVYNIFMYSNAWIRESQVDFQQERETSSAALEALRELGESAGLDVTSCTDNAQILLTGLTSTLEDNLTECLVFSNVEAATIQNDARYYMDTVMTEVRLFDYQLNVCEENFLCIEPILTQILDGKVTIPQKIGVEFDKARDLGEDLKILIKQCVSDAKSQMVAESTNIVSNATGCVNKLMP